MTARTLTRASRSTVRAAGAQPHYVQRIPTPAPERVPEMPPLAVSPNEAARLLGVCRTSIYALIASHEIASFSLGARRLIPVSALEAWVSRQMAPATTEREGNRASGDVA